MGIINTQGSFKKVIVALMLALAILIGIAMSINGNLPFIIEPEIIAITANENPEVSQVITITSLLDKDIIIYPGLIGLNGKIPEEINLPSQDSKQISLVLSVPENSYGTLVGNLELSSDSGKNYALIIIDSETKEVILDAEIEPQFKQAMPGDEITFLVSLHSNGNYKEDVKLQYSLISASGKTVLSENENIDSSSWKKASISKQIKIPEYAKLGKYVFSLKIVSGNSISAASTSFEVGDVSNSGIISKTIMLMKNSGGIWPILKPILIVLLIIMALKLISHKKESIIASIGKAKNSASQLAKRKTVGIGQKIEIEKAKYQEHHKKLEALKTKDAAEDKKMEEQKLQLKLFLEAAKLNRKKAISRLRSMKIKEFFANFSFSHNSKQVEMERRERLKEMREREKTEIELNRLLVEKEKLRLLEEKRRIDAANEQKKLEHKFWLEKQEELERERIAELKHQAKLEEAQRRELEKAEAERKMKLIEEEKMSEEEKEKAARKAKAAELKRKKAISRAVRRFLETIGLIRDQKKIENERRIKMEEELEKKKAEIELNRLLVEKEKLRLLEEKRRIDAANEQKKLEHKFWLEKQREIEKGNTARLREMHHSEAIELRKLKLREKEINSEQLALAADAKPEKGVMKILEKKQKDAEKIVELEPIQKQQGGIKNFLINKGIMRNQETIEKERMEKREAELKKLKQEEEELESEWLEAVGQLEDEKPKEE